MQLHPPVYRRLPLPLLLLLLLPLLILLLLLLLPYSLHAAAVATTTATARSPDLPLPPPEPPTMHPRPSIHVPNSPPSTAPTTTTTTTTSPSTATLLILSPLHSKLILRNPMQGLPTKLSLLATFLQEYLLPQNLYHLEKSSAAARPTKQACLAKNIKLPALSAHRNRRHSS